MKKKSNVDILMIMFGFTFFSGSMLIGQKLSSGVKFSDFLVCILIGGTLLGIFGGIIVYFVKFGVSSINAIIITSQVSSIILDRSISVSQCRKQNFSKNISGKNYKVYPVYYPIGNGMMNIDKAVEDLDYIIRTNLKSQKDMDDFER